MKKLLLLLSAYGAWWLWKQTQPPQGMAYLHGRVVIITGASAGIGRATAKTFAGQGAKVVLVARRAEALEALKAEIEKTYNTQALVIQADLTDSAQLQPIVDKTLETFGQIDVLVNNAGDVWTGLFHEMTADQIEQQITLNLINTIKLTQLVLPTMKQQQRGHIVNVASVSGYIHPPTEVNYSASKAGLIGFSEALRREIKPDGINVSNVCPGFTNTDILGNFSSTDQVFEAAKKAGVDTNGITIFAPEEIAGEIVNAVRYNRHRVIKGGPVVNAFVWAGQHLPELNDLLLEQTDFKGNSLRFHQFINSSK